MFRCANKNKEIEPFEFLRKTLIEKMPDCDLDYNKDVYLYVLVDKRMRIIDSRIAAIPDVYYRKGLTSLEQQIYSSLVEIGFGTEGKWRKSGKGNRNCGYYIGLMRTSI